MKKSIALIGGGPAGLAFASCIDTEKYDVTIYEKNKAVGRKFLVAGDGGFNLTHSEDLPQFVERYTPTDFLVSSLKHFCNTDTRTWLKGLGIETFIGSSKRIYPIQGIKPIQVINAIVDDIKSKGIKLELNKVWTGWNNDKLTFESGEPIQADIVIFALGGGSWKVTGSDGNWLDTFEQQGIKTIPFSPANCAYAIKWNEKFKQRFEGTPLKNIAVSFGSKTQKGELVITSFGVEGNAIYALSPEIQPELNKGNSVEITIDFKPVFSESEIISKIEVSTFKNRTETLKRGLKLSKVQLELLKTRLTKEQYMSNKQLAHFIKEFPLVVNAAADLDEAISTTGGIALKAINDNFELIDKKSTYCIGEMLDWNAPTGGYLLQACFSMGARLAGRLNTSLASY
ncbi:MAG: TIGR03862 family flavoprotein [Crocinitomicaceae bacterium]|nr:TIGR03862 family flavoprotein [Crocinitomicaceae bacterium]